jgi:adenylate cyclase
MKTLLIILSLISIIASQTSFATGDIESFFTNEKKTDIKNRDLKGSAKAINKALGTKDIEADIDWNTFEKVGYSGAQSLGANLQTVTGVIVNGASSDDSLKKSLAKKMKKLVLRHDASMAVPAFKLDGSTLVFVGNYENMDWKKAGPLKDLLKKAL